MAKIYHHIDHGDPSGATYNREDPVTATGPFIIGANLKSPDLCGLICYQTLSLVQVIINEIDTIFPKE